MAAVGVAERHRALAERALAYLQGPYGALPGGRLLGPRLGAATVLVRGAHALGAAGDGAPLDVCVVLAGEEWERLRAAARPSDLWSAEPAGGRPVAVRLRGPDWLRRRLGETPELWLLQRAALAADPGGRFASAVAGALEAFRARLPDEVVARYADFRRGFEGADAALDAVGRAALLGTGAAAALALPALARGEPYPPPRWLAWHLGRVWAEGERAAALCARALTGPAVDREAYATLRRLVDEALDQAGHGEAVVRAYRGLD